MRLPRRNQFILLAAPRATFPHIKGLHFGSFRAFILIDVNVQNAAPMSQPPCHTTYSFERYSRKMKRRSNAACWRHVPPTLKAHGMISVRPILPPQHAATIKQIYIDSLKTSRTPIYITTEKPHVRRPHVRTYGSKIPRSTRHRCSRQVSLTRRSDEMTNHSYNLILLPLNQPTISKVGRRPQRSKCTATVSRR
jgi:hypothetical protein